MSKVTNIQIKTRAFTKNNKMLQIKQLKFLNYRIGMKATNGFI